jgi:hypothetical protein
LVIYDPARYRNEPVEERKKFSTFKINFFEWILLICCFFIDFYGKKLHLKLGPTCLG